jgi:hypothetical protein
MNQLKKKLSLLIASSSLVLLTGCSTLTNLYDAYFMAGYDTNEYGLITNIRTISETSISYCSDTSKIKVVANTLYVKSIEFKNFTQYIPNNEDANKLSLDLVKLTKQAKEIYDKGDTVSEGFCKIKLQQINRSAEKIQQVIGSKSR